MAKSIGKKVHCVVLTAISGVTKEVGNFHGKSLGNDLSHPSVGTHGRDRDPIGISGFDVS